MYYVGVDIGGTGIKVGIVTDGGEIIAKGAISTSVKDGYEVIVKEMAKLIEDTVSDAKITPDDVASIGIGCPGSIDDRKGEVIYSNNLEFKNVPLCAELKKYIDKPIYINNDANCAALGEFLALGDDTVEDFVAITLGTGVGGGVIINKKLYTGFNSVAGELGHMVIKVDGEQCTCGRKGCWEAYASATALIREAEKAAEKNLGSLLTKRIAENGGKCNGKMVWDAKDEGDETAQSVIDTYVKYVAEGIINLVNIFQPSVVAIGGGASKQGDNLLLPVKKYMEGKTYGGSLVKSAEIVTAKLGNDAGIIGAAFLGK